MKRLFDLCLAIPLSVTLFVPLLLIVTLVRLPSHGSALFWSDPVGYCNVIFQRSHVCLCKAPPQGYLPRVLNAEISTFELAT